MMGLEGHDPRRRRQDGVKLYVDLDSQALVSGMTVDFVTGLDASGFVFGGQNATRSVRAASQPVDRNLSGEQAMWDYTDKGS